MSSRTEHRNISSWNRCYFVLLGFMFSVMRRACVCILFPGTLYRLQTCEGKVKVPCGGDDGGMVGHVKERAI